MVSGREGSQSPIAEGKAERHRQKSEGMTASMFHILQREELLGYQENIPVNIVNAYSGASLTASSSPPVSPHKLVAAADPPPKHIKQRLRSPRSSCQAPEAVMQRSSSPRKEVEDHSLEEVLRGSLRRSPRKEAEDCPAAEDIPVALGKRSTHRGKEKSPFNSRRHKGEMVTVEDLDQGLLDAELRKRPKADDLELPEKTLIAPERVSSRSGRLTRRSRTELQEITEGVDGLGVEAIAKASRRGQGRRQHKRKALELPMLPTQPAFPEESFARPPELSRNSSTSSRKCRRAGLHCKTWREGNNWLQYIEDLIMWRDVPKSALVFGLGSFGVLSSCFTQDLHISAVTTVSYLALFYLAAVFFHRSFFHRGAIDLNPGSTDYEFSEADVLRVARLVLPPINALFAKMRELFSGEPATTLKVASILWLLAECGHTMSIWTLTRLGFFVAFTIPKLYSCYSAQLRVQGNYLLRRGWEIWTACPHKKAFLAAATTLAWNLSSVTARVSGAFIMIVAFRFYQQSFRNCNEVPLEENLETDAKENTGLELMNMSQADL